MAENFNLNFDATQTQPNFGGRSILPPGQYRVAISDVERKLTANGKNGMLVMTFKVIEGPETGSTIDYRLNMWHESAQTIEIAQKQLSGVCHAIGLLRVGNSAEMLGKPLGIRVSHREYEAGTPPTKRVGDEVSEIFDVNFQKPGQGPVTAAAAPAGFAAPATAPATNGWQAPVATAPAPAVAQAPAAGWTGAATTAAPPTNAPWGPKA